MSKRTERKTSPPASASGGWMRAAAVPAALFLATALLYLPSAGNGFLYDDRLLILRQSKLGSASDVAALFGREYYAGLPYYRPVTAATFAIQKTLHGDDPLPFHVFNVLFAGIVTVLVFYLLRRPGLGIAPWAALLGAAAFVAHPVFSSCVHPISGRDTLLAIAFVCGSVLAFLRGTRVASAVGVGLFALGLLSKEATVVTPGIVLLADALGLSVVPVRGARRWIARAAPMVLVFAAYAAVRFSLFAGGEFKPGELFLVPLSYLYLIQITLAPFAALFYEPTVAAWLSIPRLAVSALILAALAAAAAAAWRPIRGPLAFWLGWMALALLPVANLVRQETQFDERYSALAALGILAIPAVVISARCSTERARRVALTAGWAIVTVLAAVSFHRGPSFEELAFYRRWIEVRPDSVKPRFNLGNALGRRGKLDEAIEEYRKALEIDANAARVHYNLGLAYAQTSKLDLATNNFREAVRLDPANTDARLNLGSALARAGDLRGAEAQFREALRLAPSNSDAISNLGYALVQQGKYEEAVARLGEAVRLVPNDPTPHRFLGIALLRSGRSDAAEREFLEALRLDPRDAEAKRFLEELRRGPEGGIP